MRIILRKSFHFNCNSIVHNLAPTHQTHLNWCYCFHQKWLWIAINFINFNQNLLINWQIEEVEGQQKNLYQSVKLAAIRPNLVWDFLKSFLEKRDFKPVKKSTWTIPLTPPPPLWTDMDNLETPPPPYWSTWFMNDP